MSWLAWPPLGFVCVPPSNPGNGLPRPVVRPGECRCVGVQVQVLGCGTVPATSGRPRAKWQPRYLVMDAESRANSERVRYCLRGRSTRKSFDFNSLSRVMRRCLSPGYLRDCDPSVKRRLDFHHFPPSSKECPRTAIRESSVADGPSACILRCFEQRRFDERVKSNRCRWYSQ